MHTVYYMNFFWWDHPAKAFAAPITWFVYFILYHNLASYISHSPSFSIMAVIPYCTRIQLFQCGKCLFITWLIFLSISGSLCWALKWHPRYPSLNRHSGILLKTIKYKIPILPKIWCSSTPFAPHTQQKSRPPCIFSKCFTKSYKWSRLLPFSDRDPSLDFFKESPLFFVF